MPFYSTFAVFGSDYTLSSTVVVGRPCSTEKVIAIFQVDGIAQESVEYAQLRFSPINSNAPPGAILQDVIQFVILDSDGKRAYREFIVMAVECRGV